jgi:hypothetical protein
MRGAGFQRAGDAGLVVQFEFAQYHFCIMSKLVASLIFVALLSGRPCVAVQQQGSTHAEQNEPSHAPQPVPPTHVVIDPPIPAPSSQQLSETHTNESADISLPGWRRPEWVIVYVTALYCFIAWLTLRPIKKQADLMERQAADAKKSGADTLAAIKEQNDNLLISAKAATVMAMASNKSAKAALSQIEMVKDKERARVEIKALGLELTRVSEDFWHIRATIELRNVGMGRAYVRLGEGSLAITEEKPNGLSLDVVDGFIDPSGDPTTESFYFFQPDDASRGEYSQKICDGVFVPRIIGFIEYETVGTRFHRDFHYAWIGHGSPLNVSAFMSRGGFVPVTDEDKVSFGFWSSSWISGSSGDNDEYEMQPQKKKKKPPQNPT